MYIYSNLAQDIPQTACDIIILYLLLFRYILFLLPDDSIIIDFLFS